MTHPTRRDAIKLAVAAAAVLPTLPGSPAAAATVKPIGLGRDQTFDLGWRFHRGAGEGFEAAGFDDAGWRAVDLPHDWSIEDVPGGPANGAVGPFDRKAVGGTFSGFTVGGEGWYRKRFRLDDLPQDAQASILFDGVVMVTDVWLNGRPLGGHVHGYTPFHFDLTPHLARNAENVIAVRVRNIGQTSRWYPGSGIYRPVTLHVIPSSARVAQWGVAAWTRRIGDGRALVDVTTQLDNTRPGLRLRTLLKTASGAVAATALSPATTTVKQTLQVEDPQLWSPESPHLYSLETELLDGDRVIDRTTESVGLRIITITPERGMEINGKTFVLRGGCVHHDNGIIGASVYPDAEERRIKLLQARGFNAIRSTHNPCSRAFRHACDRLGVLLIEEVFDVWQAPKRPDDYSVYFRKHWQEDVRATVLSARNSPSVFMWSIGNEVPERLTPEGIEWSWKLSNEARRLDPTRPVTAAIHKFMGRPLIAGERTARRGFAGKADSASTIFLDVMGCNYKIKREDTINPDGHIELYHQEFPERVMYASESLAKDAYDYMALAKRAPYMLGEFVWTAMDYLGEAGLGASSRVASGGAAAPQFPEGDYPWVNANCGDIDLIGQRKPQSFARDVIWGHSPLEMAVQRPIPDGQVELVSHWGWSDELQSWNWPGAEGKPLAVRLYSSGDRVELRLNGVSIGEQRLEERNKMRAEFKVPYAPGTLEAVAFSGEREIARRRIETVAAPAKLRLTAEKPSSRAARDGLTYVRIEVLDAQDRLVPEAKVDVRLAIDGPAELLGFGNANPFAEGSFKSVRAKTYLGRALLVLRSQGRPGRVSVAAQSDGLKDGGAQVVLA